MKFGYVWRGSGARDEKHQRKVLTSYGVTAKRLIRETSPARDERDRIFSILRKGDEVCVVSAQYLADDIVELHWLFASANERGAHVYVAEFGRKFTGSVDMAQITEDYIGVKRKEQTQAARDRLKKLPVAMRGGRPRRQLTAEEETKFIADWENKFVSKGKMAKDFKCHKDKLEEWRQGLGLGEKACE